MTGSDGGLQARRWLCRTLSPYCADRPVAAPDPALWPGIVRLSDSGMVSARLSGRLRGHDFVPPQARAILDAIAGYAQDRAILMRGELTAIIAALNAAGIRPVVFKGAEWLLGHYSPQAGRMMTDLDIWIPCAAEQMRALEALQRIGYVPMEPWAVFDKSNSHHFPPVHRADAIARLEVHHGLVRAGLAHMLPLAEVEKRLVPARRDGLSYRRLAPQDGISIAYLQSGHMAAPGFGTRRVAISKWLDFLDRLHAHGPAQIRTARDIGLSVEDTAIDRQLLTVLDDFFGLPYRGIRDTGYIDTWDRPMSPQGRILKGLHASATRENLRRPEKWVGFVRGFGRRIRESFFISGL